MHPDLEITKTKLILNRQELGISHPSWIPRRKNPVPLPRKPKTRGKTLQPQITLWQAPSRTKTKRQGLPGYPTVKEQVQRAGAWEAEPRNQVWTIRGRLQGA